MVIWWTTSPHDPRALIGEPSIRCSSFGFVTCTQNSRVELSPTRRKLKKRKWFIRCDDYEGLASSEYGMLICTITLINKIYLLYTRHIVPRRRRMGPRGAATSHPHGSRAKISPFFLFFNYF